MPVVQAFYRLAAQRFMFKPVEPDKKEEPVADHVVSKTLAAYSTVNPPPKQVEPETDPGDMQETIGKPLSHYVLLPLYAWGAGEWDLQAIQLLLKETHPTVGFSLTEARLASRVTVIGGEGAISIGAVEMLRQNGCIVERVQEDGTLVAP